MVVNFDYFLVFLGTLSFISLVGGCVGAFGGGLGFFSFDITGTHVFLGGLSFSITLLAGGSVGGGGGGGLA